MMLRTSISNGSTQTNVYLDLLCPFSNYLINCVFFYHFINLVLSRYHSFPFIFVMFRFHSNALFIEKKIYYIVHVSMQSCPFIYSKDTLRNEQGL